MRASVTISTVLLLVIVPATRAQFAPGDVYVSEAALALCRKQDEIPGGTDRIWRVDPRTGEVWLFAELTGDMCGGVSGLVFTPDGQRLRAASIVLFPADDGMEMVFADRFDSVGGGGSIAFAQDGHLYYAPYSSTREFLRISAAGEAEPFDDLTPVGSIESLTADLYGHVFVGLHRGGSGDDQILRYTAGDSGSRTPVSKLPQRSGYLAMTLTPDHSRIYVVALPLGWSPSIVWSMNPQTGDLTKVAAIGGLFAGSGIAVVPVPSGTGDFNGDSTVDLTDFRPFQACFESVVGTPLPRACRAGDLDGDYDVDLIDYAGFQRSFSPA